MSSPLTPVDSYYYNVLDVPTDADYMTIKMAYKKGAIKFHPDKNKAPDAEEKFKAISEAYQILGSTELRSQYDKYGRNDDLRPVDGFVDSNVYFQRMYGGGSFRDLIGELNIGHFMALDLHANTEEEKRQALLNQIQQQQKERVDKLASLLGDKLSQYVSERHDLTNDKEQSPIPFEKRIHQEATDLKKESYGPSLLLTVGRLYSIQAKEYINAKRIGGLSSIYYSVKEKKHITKELWKTVKSNMEAQMVAEKVTLAEKEGIKDISELDELLSAKSYQALWQMVRFEVEATLRKVCRQVLHDKTINADERLLRAEGLLLLGDTFASTDISPQENDVTRMN